MILIIVGAVIGGVSFFSLGLDPFFDGIGGALVGAAMGFMCAMFVGLAAYGGHTEMRPFTTTPLVSMADGAGVEGHFFLGSGSLDSTSTFTWYEKSGDNSYVRRDANATDATVHYVSADQKPYYRMSKECSIPDGFWHPLALNAAYGCYDPHYDFYIPKGSIVQSYVLDNK